MYPSFPRVDYSVFKTKPEDFKEYCWRTEEDILHRMPRPRGMKVATTSFVDSSHESNKVMWRSHSGHILFVNRAPVKWLSQRQQTVETSVFHHNLSQWNTALSISSIYGSRSACLVYRLPGREHQHMFGVIMRVWWRIHITWILSSTRSTRKLHSTSHNETWQLGYALLHGFQKVSTL